MTATLTRGAVTLVSVSELTTYLLPTAAIVAAVASVVRSGEQVHGNQVAEQAQQHADDEADEVVDGDAPANALGDDLGDDGVE